jgi:flagellar biosynthesis protein FlhG
MLETNKQPYLLTICSGKGGVGKSVITANVAYQLTENYDKVLIIDVDLMFPNQHLMFGIDPNLRIDDWLLKRAKIDRIIYEIAPNLSIIAGAIGNIDLELQNNFSFIDLYNDILLETDFDYILVDSAAGISNTLIECASISDKIGIVVTDEPASVVDAYALIKILKEYSDNRKMNLILNNVIDDEDANEIIQKINKATQHFLEMSIDVLGIIPYNPDVRKSIILQELLSMKEPKSKIIETIKKISKTIISANK